MKEIPLSKGLVAIVDDKDFPLVCSIKWSASFSRKGGKRRVYAVAEKDGIRLAMHRLIMGNPDSDVDHRDADRTLDNRRSNLRLASRSDNNGNGRKRDGTSSRFKGVFLHRQTGKWCAQICRDRQKKHIGLFNTEANAAQGYNFAADELFGEFARFNIAC